MPLRVIDLIEADKPYVITLQVKVMEKGRWNGCDTNRILRYGFADESGVVQCVLKNPHAESSILVGDTILISNFYFEGNHVTVKRCTRIYQ